MKIEIEITGADNDVRKDLMWLFTRLVQINEGTGVSLTAKHNSSERNEVYLDGDGPVRVDVSVTQTSR